VTGLRNDGRVDRFNPGRQPGGRAPAPGRLGLVQAFVNAFWDLDAGGADMWADAAGYRGWLLRRGFGAGGAGETERAQAVEVREALRELARRNHDDEAAIGAAPALEVLDRTPRATPVAVRFDPAPRHEPLGDGHAAALGLVLGIVAEAMADGAWLRLKACPGPHCGWLFYDASRNHSSQWCSMRICGNRVKGQRFRTRHAEPAGQ
jgi:predicted RNA-binding Zn ribbon-like protein